MTSELSLPRVLFLTSNYPRWPGDTTTPFVQDLALELAGRGWDVSVLAPHAPGADRQESINGVVVRRFRYLFPERAQTVCYGGGALVNMREGRATKAKLPALVVSEWLAAARALSRGVDLIHAHWTLPQGFVATSIPLRRAPCVLTVHGGDVFGLRGQMLDRFSRYALRHAERVTVNSTATAAAVREIGGSEVRMEQVPIGVDLSRQARPEVVEAVRRKYRSTVGPLLVFVGRIIEEKGVEDVVYATSLLRHDLPGVSAVIGGTGQHLGRVESLIKALGVGERVHLPGWIDPGDVPSWLAAGDVVLAPSRIGADGWTEGQGLSIIEAMAASRPVISTRTGGIPEIVTHGRTGLLVPPADPGAIAKAVRTLVESPEVAARMAQHAELDVRSRFSRSLTLDRFEGIYRELLGTSRTRGRIEKRASHHPGEH